MRASESRGTETTFLLLFYVFLLGKWPLLTTRVMHRCGNVLEERCMATNAQPNPSIEHTTNVWTCIGAAAGAKQEGVTHTAVLNR